MEGLFSAKSRDKINGLDKSDEKLLWLTSDTIPPSAQN